MTDRLWCVARAAAFIVACMLAFALLAGPAARGALQGRVYLHSGELEIRAVDLAVGGRAGWNVVVDRTYRSRGIEAPGVLGQGWTSSLFRHVRELPNRAVEYHDAQGEVWLFTPKGDGTYVAPTGLFLRLGRRENGWVLVDQQWRIMSFDLLGRITAASDEFFKGPGTGNTIQYFYDAAGQLREVVDPVGRATQIAYYANEDTSAGALPGGVAEITDWRGRHVTYHYNTLGLLTEVLLPQVQNTTGVSRPTIHYTYLAAAKTFNERAELAANLTGIIDPNEVATGGSPRVTYTYGTGGNDYDRVLTEQWGTGETATFAYTSSSVDTVDVLGQHRTYTIVGERQHAHIASIVEHDVPTSLTAVGELPSAADPKSFPTPAQDRTWTFTYNPDDTLKTTTLGGVKTATYSYKAAGAAPGVVLQSVTTTPASDAGGEPITRSFTYQTAAPSFLQTVSANGLAIDVPAASRDQFNPVATNSSILTTNHFDAFGRLIASNASGGTDPASTATAMTISYVSATGPLFARGEIEEIHNGDMVTKYSYPTPDRIVITDPRGITTTTDYDSWRRPTHVVVAGPGQTMEETYSCDATGRLRLHKRRLNGQDVTTVFEYDLVGRQTSVATDHVATDAGSIDATTAYDLPKHLITHTATGGAVTQTTIDALGRPIRVVTNTGTTPIERSFAYDLADHPVYESDLASASAAAYDIHDRMVARRHRNGTRETLAYDAWAHLLSAKQHAIGGGGVLTGEQSFSYTPAGALQSTTTKVDDTRTRATTFVWDAGGRTTGVATNGRASRLTFDASGRPTLFAQGSGNATALTTTITTTEYAAHTGTLPQQRIAHEASDAYTTVLQYNTAGDVVEEALGPLSWSRRFDEDRNLTGLTPPSRPETAWSYDSLSALTKEQQPQSPPATIDWHKSGSPFHYADPTAQVTTQDADLAGRPLKRTYPDATTDAFSYQGPRVESITDRQGRTQLFTINSKDQLVRVDRPGGEQLQQIDYDEAGRPFRWTNKDTAIQFADFDLEGRPGTIVQTRYQNATGFSLKEILDEYTIRHRWNEFGEAEYTQFPTYQNMPATPGWTRWLRKHYDALGNLTSVERVPNDSATTGEVVWDATFRSAGRPDQRTVYARAPAGTATAPIIRTYTYEPGTSRLQKVAVTVKGHEVAGSAVTAFDGMQIKEAALLGVSGDARTSHWSYDPKSRLVNTTIGRTTTEQLTDADFRTASVRQPRFDASTRAQLVSKGIDVEALDPSTLSMSEAPGHKIMAITQGTATRTVTHNGSERQDDGNFAYEFDERGRLTRATQKTTNLQTIILRVTYTWDDHDHMVGRRVETAHTSTPNDWHLATSALLTDALPADATFVWDPMTDTIMAIFKAGASQHPEIDTNGGLVRQIIEGGVVYDDPLEVTVADPVNEAQLRRLYPVYDEAATGSLQATVNSSGEVVARAVIGDAYGDDRSVIGGAAVDRIRTTAKKAADGTLTSVTVEIRATEALRANSITAGARLAILDSTGVLLRTAPNSPAAAGDFSLQYTLTAAQWQAFVDPAPVTIDGVTLTPTILSIAVTKDLRAALWAGDGPLLPAPAWASSIKPIFTSAALPVEARESLTSIASWLGGIPPNGEHALTSYEAQDLRLVAADDPPDDPSRLLVNSPFQALPFFDSITHLSLARARWLDHQTGTFVSPDPLGYRDSANLYAFAGGDPVNHRDPTGLCDRYSMDPRQCAGELQAFGQKVADWWDSVTDPGRDDREARALERRNIAKILAARMKQEGYPVEADTPVISPTGNWGLDASGRLLPPYEGIEDQTGDVVMLVTGLKAESTILKTAAGVGEREALTIGIANNVLRRELIARLEQAGIKHTASSIVAIRQLTSGQIVFLETGSETAGLTHILRHAAAFESQGIARETIPDVLMKALAESKVIGYQGKGLLRPVYEVVVNGQVKRVAITVGDNGFIVGANPVSRSVLLRTVPR